MPQQRDPGGSIARRAPFSSRRSRSLASLKRQAELFLQSAALDSAVEPADVAAPAAMRVCLAPVPLHRYVAGRSDAAAEYCGWRFFQDPLLLGEQVPGTEYEDGLVYLVVVNAEEQYSIWPQHKPLPSGWRAVGKQGPKVECLKYIDEVWTDMRPLSLRNVSKASNKR